jgi:hypothetical protein
LEPGKASEWSSKGKTFPLDRGQLESHTKLQICRKLHTNNIGHRYCIQLNWSIGRAFISNFPSEKVPGRSLKFSTFCDSPNNNIFTVSKIKLSFN